MEEDILKLVLNKIYNIKKDIELIIINEMDYIEIIFNDKDNIYKNNKIQNELYYIFAEYIYKNSNFKKCFIYSFCNNETFFDLLTLGQKTNKIKNVFLIYIKQFYFKIKKYSNILTRKKKQVYAEFNK